MVGHALNFISANRQDEALCLFIPLPSPCLCIYWERAWRFGFQKPSPPKWMQSWKKAKIL